MYATDSIPPSKIIIFKKNEVILISLPSLMLRLRRFQVTKLSQGQLTFLYNLKIKPGDKRIKLK